MRASTRQYIWGWAFFALAGVAYLFDEQMTMQGNFVAAMVLFVSGDILKALDK